MIRLIKYLRRWLLSDIYHNETATQSLINREIDEILSEIARNDENALILLGRKVYSQCDEDGIIEEIFNRIGTTNKTFIEIGCGQGLENNTHYLLLKGWKGIWIDGSKDNIRFIKNQIGYREGRNKKLSIAHSYVDKDNINQILKENLVQLAHEETTIDFLSVDIDGNDLEVLSHINVVNARLICVEYNAKFPPSVHQTIKYDPTHRWQKDDYQGSSLAAIHLVMESQGYTLVSCSIAGTNAFFVKNEDIAHIDVLPFEKLYMPARYHLCHKDSGLPASLKFLKNMLYN
ncbi:MAG: hypothetical protein VX294_06730 [Candidatus Latescibacterota bacterium]|nr:hypothetical protein [Candidatus Latescibacterota bacterium]